MKPIKRAFAGKGRTRICAELCEIGPDPFAIIGGEGIHIRAATPAEHVSDEEIKLATLSGLGHRESELTSEFSKAIASVTGRRTLTIASIHLDHISKSEIEAIRENARKLVSLLAPTEEPSGSSASESFE